MRYVISKNGRLEGSYPVSTDEKACDACKTDDDALNAYAQDQGYESFAALKKETGLTVTDFGVEPIKD